MSRTRILIAAALVASGGAVNAAGSTQTINLDGSTRASAPRAPSLAASASSALEKANVPSTRTDPIDVKTAADADMQRRDKRAVAPHLKAERQNLKGDDAARAIAQQQNPSTFDHTMANGDKDHTEQVTNLKIYLKK